MIVNSYPFAERLRTSRLIRRIRPSGRSEDPARPTGRASRFLLAGVATAVLAVAGCSSAAAPGGQGGTGNPAKVTLTFSFSGAPASQPKQLTLTCEPTGGTHPDPAAACAALLKLNNPFAPRSKTIACPMILRSDQKILVTGTWLGKPVHRVVLDGGCDLVLFSKLHQILH